MAKRILVPVDRSDQALAAFEFALDEFPDATLVLLHVLNPAEAGYSTQASIPAVSEEWYDREKEAAEELLADLAADARAAGIAVEEAVEVGRPTTAIVEHVADNDIDQIVMGSHGRSGVSRILLGSVAETVVRRATVPVTVAR